MTLVLVLCLAAQVPGSIDLDPALGWYTLETDHFAVHFSCRGRPDDDSLILAQHAAAICEEVYSTVGRASGWYPAGRTNVVIADFFDYWNGWATPFPDNTITVIPTPPGASRTNFEDWLREVILHEYSHIVQMDQVSGVMRGLRYVFGRVVLPNALAPVWLDEGYAVYNETRFSSFGRLRSAEYDMAARAAADSGRLLPADRCGSYELQRFPGGNAPYLYGSWLHASVTARGDSTAWDRYNRSRSSGLPFFDNLYAARTLGASIYSLWDQSNLRLINEAALTSRRLNAQPLTPLRRLTPEGWNTASPLWSRSGKEVYYISNTGREYPAVKALDTLGNAPRVLHRGAVTGNLSLSPDGRLLAFAQFELLSNSYEFTDIYALDLAWGGVRRLTDGERASDPDFASDTSLLVYVANGHGRNSLKLLNLRTGEKVALTQAEEGTSFHGPRFSPSGKWIVTGVRRAGGYADIELVDRRTGWTIPVTHDRANDISPCWSRTGKYVFYVSDRTGVYNVFAYQLSTGTTFQCTNVLYGVFQPTVSPDNRHFALVSYSSGGDDISMTPYSAAGWHEVPEFKDTLPEFEPAEPVKARLYYYDPFPTILPRFWLPFVLPDEGLTVGAFTLGWDALQMHRYAIAAGYDRAETSPVAALAYELRRFRPTFTLLASADKNSQSAALAIGLPFRSIAHLNQFDLAPRIWHDSAFLSRLDFDWLFSNEHTYRFCVTPVEGRSVGLHVDGTRAGILSDRSVVRILGHYTEYVGRPPETWSLQARVAAGTSFGDSSAGGSFEIGVEPGLLGVRGYSRPAESAKSILTAGVEFRMPLWWMERGLGTGPLFLRNLNGAVFADFGVSTDSLVPGLHDWQKSRLGVGGELRLDVIAAHLLPVSVTAGAGFGVNPFWSWRGYVVLSSSMLDGLLNRSGRGSRFTFRPIAEQ